MWKFCTLTFLYGAVFLWHHRRRPSLAEVSAGDTYQHCLTLSCYLGLRNLGKAQPLPTPAPSSGLHTQPETSPAQGSVESGRKKHGWVARTGVWLRKPLPNRAPVPGMATHCAHRSPQCGIYTRGQHKKDPGRPTCPMGGADFPRSLSSYKSRNQHVLATTWPARSPWFASRSTEAMTSGYTCPGPSSLP